MSNESLMSVDNSPNQIRLLFGNVLAELDAPEHFVHHINDLSIEDSLIAPIYHLAWKLDALEVAGREELVADDVFFYVEDTVLHLISNFNNPMNFCSGCQQQVTIDVMQVVNKITSRILKEDV